MTFKLELRNISRNEALSEETHCYSAKLFLDGVHIADVGNHGHGGPDHVHARKGHETALAKVEAYFKTLPPLPTEYKMPDGSPMELTQDLELWCGTQVDDFIVLKDMRRALKRKVLIQKDGKIMEYSWKGLKEVTPKHVEHIRAKHPEAVILNSLPEVEALRIYKAA